MDASNITTPVSPEICTSSSSSTSSAPHYSEDVRRPLNNLDLLTHYNSNSSSKFFCEIDLGEEERDTFSPVNSDHHSPSACAMNILNNGENVHESVDSITAATAAAALITTTNLTTTSHTITNLILNENHHIAVNNDHNNKHYENILPPALKTKLTNSSTNNNNNNMHSIATPSSKEEKQRQNEEIVIFETSSISSETGSWESNILPQNVSSSTIVGVVNSTQSMNMRDKMDLNASIRVDDFLYSKDGKLNVNNSTNNTTITTTTTNITTAINASSTATATITNTMKNVNSSNLKVGEETAENLSIDLSLPTSSSRLLRETENIDHSNGREAGNFHPFERDFFSACDNNVCGENVVNKSHISNCFIDASSLCDENEVVSFTNLNDTHDNSSTVKSTSISANNFDDNEYELDHNENDSPTRRLEIFHKSFARCKIKSLSQKESMTKDDDTECRPQSSSSCSSHEHENQQNTHSGHETVSNLSDEEKLWKRDHINLSSSQGSRATTSDDKKFIDLNKHELPNTTTTSDEVTEASISLAQDVDSSDSSDFIKTRQRRGGGGGNCDGNLEKNRQAFNGLHLQQQEPLQQQPTPGLPLTTATAKGLQSGGTPLSLLQNAQLIGHCDLSYTTDYSSSSPAPSLVWSEHDQQRFITTNQARSITNINDYDQNQTRKTFNNNNQTNPNQNSTNMSNILPDTPHNSMVQIDATSSNSSSTHRDYTLSSPFSQYRDSGAYCSDATDSPILLPRTPKKSKYDECNPIISVGSAGSGGGGDLDTKQWQDNYESLEQLRERNENNSNNNNTMSYYQHRHHYKHHKEQIDNFSDNNSETIDTNEDVHEEVKNFTKKAQTGVSSWIVDMSDCQRTDKRKSSTSTPDANHQVKNRERSDSVSSHKSALGFYIPLTEPNKKKSTEDHRLLSGSLSKSYNAPTSVKYCSAMSVSEYTPKTRTDGKEKLHSDEGNTNTNSEHNSERKASKNLFSMFIDIGNGEKKVRRNNNRREPFNLAQKLSYSLNTNHSNRNDSTETVLKSSASSTETLISKNFHTNFQSTRDTSDDDRGECKSLDYKTNVEKITDVQKVLRNEEVVPKVRTSNHSSKRHSWSNNNANNHNHHNTTISKMDCKRSISLQANDMEQGGPNSDKGLMSIIDKLPILSKTICPSTLSVDSSMSPFDEYKSSKSELSGASPGTERYDENNGNEKDSCHSRIKKRRRDVQLNETFDKSSAPSITDGILSKDISPLSNTTETDDLTFQQDDERISVNIHEQSSQSVVKEIEVKTPSSASNMLLLTATTTTATMVTNRLINTAMMETIIETREINSPKKKLLESITMESLHATVEKQKMLLETVNELNENDKHTNYVKLSDMDKPLKAEYKSNPDSMSTSMGNHRQINRLYRDENRTRPHSWTMSRSIGNSFQNITNSIENLRSLSRLFPNLSKEISNSLPNDMSLDNMDYTQTDVSTESSLASSISRSGMDESSISCRQPRRLGEDLLKMFLQEIATDMIVEVHGRRIKAHKCILRSRCQYFAAMLAGNHTTSVVSLQGYSYFAVHFALCHIYSGASHPPDGISLMELAALADLLGLEGLKEVTSHALKTNYCHNFHKPCSGCMDGILQVLPVALNHALDDLYRKCLKWTCRHYLKVWPTRQFAQLPQDILGRCRQQIVAFLTSETVLDTILDCDYILTQLMNCRWGDECEALINDILDAAYRYMGDHFASLIASDAFLSLGHDRSCHIPRLEGILLRISSNLNADQACRSYQHITRLNIVLQAKVIQMPPGLDDLVKELQGLQNEDLEWDAEYIRLVSALLSAIEQCLIRQCSRAMRVASWQRMDLELRKKIQTLARLTEPLDLKRNRLVGKAFTFGGNSRTQDLHQFKLAIQAHTKKSLAQDNQLYKATQTQVAPVQTIERGVQANHDIKEYAGRVPKSNSRAHVPHSLGAERNIVSHRRTKSEAPIDPIMNPNKTVEAKKCSNEKVILEITPAAPTIKPKVHQLKFSEIRSRYLEPKKVYSENNVPIRSVTSSNIPNSILRGNKMGQQHSSSGSSRRSSPATSSGVACRLSAKKSTDRKSNNNISLDNLTSLHGRSKTSNNKTGKSSDNERYSDACVDSTNESLRSSIVTNRTASRDSLNAPQQMKLRSNNNKTDRLKPSIITSANNNHKVYSSGGKGKDLVSSSNNSTSKSSRPTSLGAKTPRYLQHKVISTGSSPSSVATTKSATSRLSSVSSTNSPKSIYKRSISSTVPGQHDNVLPKRSFLSAKSREILAKRAEKNKAQQQQQQQEQLQQQKQQHGSSEKRNIVKDSESKLVSGPVMRSTSHSSVIISNQARGHYPSNIPTRRPNTLQLKKVYNNPRTTAAATTTTITTTTTNIKTNSFDVVNRNVYTNHSYKSCENGDLQYYLQNNSNDEVFLRDKQSSQNDNTVQYATQKDTMTYNNNKNKDDDGNTVDKDNNYDDNRADPTSMVPVSEPVIFETKLERSSTFCKESSDIVDINDQLQIIE